MLKALDIGEIGRIIRRGIEELKGNTVNIEMKHIDSAINLISSGKTGKRINLTDGFTVEISYNNFIVNKTVEISEILIKSKQEIELLKEYKTALISEVVTGKVDVRDVILN